MPDETQDFTFSVSAPGKIILFGEHSVVFKKAAVSTSISKRLFVSLKPGLDNFVSVDFSQIGTKINCSLDSFANILKRPCPLKPAVSTLSLENPDSILYEEYLSSLQEDFELLNINLNEFQDKVKAALIGFLFVMRGMCHTLTSSLISFSLEIFSEIEIGAGTGSSAAFSVALCGSILYFKKFIEARTQVDRNLQSDFSSQDKNIINKWAFCVERLMHGRPSGIDNTTCTFGSVVVASQESGELTFKFLENIPKITLLLISSGVTRNTSKLVAKVQTLKENHPIVVDAIMNAMDVIAKDAIKSLEALGSSKCNLAEQSELFKTLSGLVQMNHGLLRTIGVSHESLEKIVSICDRFELSCKLTGAGGGGYAITLVPPNYPINQLEILKKDMEPEFKVTEISIAETGVRLEKIY